ncbi:ACER3 [Branchiostoma lanceolatum]|uniref:Alkaline ceramidase n=1 Tax=Branchiostoma lanceolatum TaxID=7740 RepID=A0A8K0EBU6_BRALA|nr:ACER3 [Branchiostoma lanceolatum]
MAPVADYPGVWGKATATIDWCEENYVVTEYVAEFWNTISNLAMIIPPILAGIKAYQEKLETRFVVSFLSILVVGIGSWCFHMTLLYEMQLFDELPMIWGSCIFVFDLFHSFTPPKYQNLPMILCLVLYSFIITAVYISIKNPIFHETAYAVLVFTLFFKSLDMLRRPNSSRALFFTALATYGTGFIIWNIDNFFCHNIREFRGTLTSPWRPLTQLHAWWHLLAGLGTYIHVLYRPLWESHITMYQKKWKRMDQYTKTDDVITGSDISTLQEVAWHLCFKVKEVIIVRKKAHSFTNFVHILT